MARKPTIAPRKPPRVDERDRFVAGDGRSGAQAPKRSGARAPIVRADGRELKKMHIYLAAKTAKQLAVFSAEVDRDMSDVVEEAVSKFLAAEAR